MFTWICPQCGREVPPSYTECPDCAAKTAAAGGAPGPQPPAPGPPAAPPPPPPRPAAPPAPRALEYPPQYPPAPPPYQPPYQPQAPYPYPPPQQFYPPQQQPYQPPQQPYPPQPGYPPQGGYPPQPYPPQPYPQQAYPPQPGYPPQGGYPPPPQSPPPQSAPPQGATGMFAAPPRSESAPAQVGPEPYTAAPQTEPAKEQVSAEAYAPPSHSPSFLGLSSGPSSAPYTAPAPEAPPQRRHLPVWLMTPIFAVVFVGVVWGIYSLVHTGGNSAPAAAVANSAAKSATPPNPYQQYIELSGVRFTVDAKKKPVVKFVVTNHSDADIQGLEANVTVLSHTQTSDTPVGTFSFKTEVGPNQSKDLTAPFDTKMQMVELPDWQFVKVDVQITAAGS